MEKRVILGRALLPLISLTLSVNSGEAQTATQEINLVSGWNAIWLEVEPRYEEGHVREGQAQDPSDVFPAGVVAVASPRPLTGVADFFADDPASVTPFNQAEWVQWNQPRAIGDDLAAVTGNRAYLINASADLDFEVTGHVQFSRPQWTPDRYNLQGFGIEGTVSFQDFFEPSEGRHPVERIYTLAADGNWATVAATEAVGDGIAYWIYADGPSDYMGPVAVDFDLAVSGELDFGGPGDAVVVGTGIDQQTLDLKEIILTNLRDVEVTPQLEFITPDPGTGALNLRVVSPQVESLTYALGNQIDTTAGDGQSAGLGETLPGRRTATLTLGASRAWNAGTVERVNVYRLTTSDPGAEYWLPIRALNNDVQAPTDLIPATDAGQVAGLWVGDVTVDAVTSLVETGEPKRTAAGTNSFRIILHSDASGQVTLLSQVTLMQTRTADRSVSPVPVLVVDRARIPFFEGIRERDGKRVGLRVEAVAYDMPRRVDAASQSELLSDPAYPTLTDAAAIPDFLESRTIRPPSLADVYHLSWTLEGALGAGKTARTSDGAPLVLDPFHRSNPFRHAFHQRHPRGPNITRRMVLVFDQQQAHADQLQGRFEESVQGLTRTGLELSGRVNLSRMSAVDTLDVAP